MICHNIGRTTSQTLWIAVTLAIITFFITPSFSIAEQKTAYMPLKINSVGQSLTLATEADNALSEALIEQNLISLSRQEASQLANYSGTWPPPNETLEKIANATGYNNVATGTITAIGEIISIDIKVVDTLSPSSPVYFYRHALAKKELGLALNELVTEIVTYTDREHRIAAISPEGNTRVDSGAILRKIKTKVGDVYSPASLREDLKAIFAMGYFNDVQIVLKDGEKGKIVTFRLEEKPMISQVIIKGRKEFKEEEIQAVMSVKEYHILNPTQISRDAQAIQAMYETKGYYNATVDTDIAFPTDAGAVVTFTIDEGDKIYIEEITFEGNDSFDADELLPQIETGEKTWWLTWLTEAGLLDMDKIRLDADRIGAYYNNHGFLDAKIGEPVVSQDEDAIYLKFIIEEGPRYKVGTVAFEGELLLDEKELAKLVTVRKEPFLNRQILRDDILSIQDAYSELGYAFASIRPRTLKSQTGNRIDLLFKITKNDLVYIDRITIKGNTRTRDNVIRRELRIVEGGKFDSAALRQSTKALQRLTFFEEVNITPEPTSDPTRMNVVVSVKEKPTGSFSIGLGYSSTDSIIVSGQISENNFLGRGDTLSFSADMSGSSQRFNLAYTDPRLNDSHLAWGVDLFSTEREYDDYDKKSKGAGIRIGYPVYEKWQLFGNYSLTNTDLSDIDEDASWIIRESADINLTSAVKLSLVRDTRNKKFMASEGSRTDFSVQYAGLGGDAEFTKFEGSTSWYFPMPLDTVIHLKGAAGYAMENSDGGLPVYERFYLGGLKSVRGFEFGKVSPQDNQGQRIGGNTMWYTNTEFIFPISDTQGINGAVFFDMGQVTDDDYSDVVISGDDVRMSTGVGLIWNSPMGPLIMVWGYNLDAEEDEDESVFDFSMGGVF